MLGKSMKWVSLVLAAFLILSLAGCGSQNASTSGGAKTVTIRLSHGLPESHYIAKQMKEWSELTMQKSNGQLEVKVFPTAQLYKDADVTEAVTTGAIEAGHGYDFTIGKQISGMRIFSVPFLYEGKVTELLAKVIASPIRTRLVDEMEKQGLKGILFIPWAMEDTGVLASKPIKNPADAKGLTFRATTEELVATFKQWGANSAYLNGAELYTGLQRGVIQGAEANVTTAVERKLYEVAPYMTLIPTSGRASIIMMNKKFYDGLKPELQKAITDAAKEVESKSVATAKANLDTMYTAAAKTPLKIYTPTPDEMKQLSGDVEKLWQSIFKDYPQILSDVKEVQKLKVELNK
jgi:C4-dicarboxylate-binding protein DctP